jgi:hypothetical protein
VAALEERVQGDTLVNNESTVTAALIDEAAVKVFVKEALTKPATKQARQAKQTQGECIS